MFEYRILIIIILSASSYRFSLSTDTLQYLEVLAVSPFYSHHELLPGPRIEIHDGSPAVNKIQARAWYN